MRKCKVIAVTNQKGGVGKTNTFEEAKTDWRTNTYTLSELRRRYGGIVFVNPK